MGVAARGLGRVERWWYEHWIASAFLWAALVDGALAFADTRLPGPYPWRALVVTFVVLVPVPVVANAARVRGLSASRRFVLGVTLMWLVVAEVIARVGLDDVNGDGRALVAAVMVAVAAAGLAACVAIVLQRDRLAAVLLASTVALPTFGAEAVNVVPVVVAVALWLRARGAARPAAS